MSFLKHLLHERISYQFYVQLVRAYNVREYFKDCASVSLRRHTKRYPTKLAVVDEFGMVAWNEGFQVPVTLYRPRNSMIFDSKCYSIRVLPSTDIKVGNLKCVIDFAHFGNLEHGQEVSLNLPLVAVSSKSPLENASVNSVMESSNFSPAAVMSRSQLAGKPSIVIKVTRCHVGNTSKQLSSTAEEQKDADSTLKSIASGFEMKSTVSDTVQLEPLLETTISHRNNHVVVPTFKQAMAKEEIVSRTLQNAAARDNPSIAEADAEDDENHKPQVPPRTTSTSTEHELRLAESMSGQDLLPMRLGRPGGRLTDAFRSEQD